MGAGFRGARFGTGPYCATSSSPFHFELIDDLPQAHFQRVAPRMQSIRRRTCISTYHTTLPDFGWNAFTGVFLTITIFWCGAIRSGSLGRFENGKKTCIVPISLPTRSSSNSMATALAVAAFILSALPFVAQALFRDAIDWWRSRQHIDKTFEIGDIRALARIFI